MDVLFDGVKIATVVMVMSMMVKMVVKMVVEMMMGSGDHISGCRPEVTLTNVRVAHAPAGHLIIVS